MCKSLWIKASQGTTSVEMDDIILCSAVPACKQSSVAPIYTMEGCFSPDFAEILIKWTGGRAAEADPSERWCVNL